MQTALERVDPRACGGASRSTPVVIDADGSIPARAGEPSCRGPCRSTAGEPCAFHRRQTGKRVDPRACGGALVSALNR